MPNIIQVTPFMLVSDLAAAVRFRVDGLGFEVGVRAPDDA